MAPVKLSEFRIEIEDPVCTVCCNTYEMAGKFECGHVVCAKCAATEFCQRKEHSCLLCHGTSKMVAIARYIDVCGQFNAIITDEKFKKLKRQHIFLHSAIEKEFKRFFIPLCDKCGLEFSSFEQLSKHSSKIHDMHYCNVCLHDAIALPIEQQVFTTKALKAHLLSHERCELCGRMFYNGTVLQIHFQKKHQRCEICRSLGVDDSFWGSYIDLWRHISEAHIECQFPECQNCGIGFGEEIDHIEHELSVHFGELSESKVLELERRVERTQYRSDPLATIEAISLYSIKQRCENRLVEQNITRTNRNTRFEHEEVADSENRTFFQHDDPKVEYKDVAVKNQITRFKFGDILNKLQLMDTNGVVSKENDLLLNDHSAEFLSPERTNIVVEDGIIELQSEDVVFLEYIDHEREFRAVRFCKCKIGASLRFNNSKTSFSSFMAMDADMPRFGRLLHGFCTGSSQELSDIGGINPKLHCLCYQRFSECVSYELILCGEELERELTASVLQQKLDIDVSHINERYFADFEEDLISLLCCK